MDGRRESAFPRLTLLIFLAVVVPTRVLSLSSMQISIHFSRSLRGEGRDDPQPSARGGKYGLDLW